MLVNAFDLFLKQKRFDLIFKYLYVKSPSSFTKNAYLENIRAFNNFSEKSSNGTDKDSSEKFITIFDNLINSIQNEGFKTEQNAIPIGRSGEIIDGAHRLAICASLGYNIETISSNLDALWDYQFFHNKGMDEKVMDYGALEYVKLNPHAYIVNLQPVTTMDDDSKVLDILNSHGFVYYKKECWLSFNGLVNFKKICYGSFWEKAPWIGSPEDGFFGAQDHANHSMGINPMRVFVFVCENLEEVQKAKKEIRDIYGIGNYSVHINDTHEEAICLAENYFNANTLFQLNTRPFHLYDEVFEKHIEVLKTECKNRNIDIDRVCGAGSTPMNVFQIRHSQDLDYLTIGDSVLPDDEIISSHNKYERNYPHPITEIITDPSFHMYYNGVKFISLDTLYAMKKFRREIPKDYLDCKKIRTIIFYRKILDIIHQEQLCKKMGTKKQCKIVKYLYKYNKKYGDLSIKVFILKNWRTLKRNYPIVAKMNTQIKKKWYCKK